MCRGHQFNEPTQPQRGDMYIGYQKPNSRKAPAGRHVYRLGGSTIINKSLLLFSNPDLMCRNLPQSLCSEPFFI